MKSTEADLSTLNSLLLSTERVSNATAWGLLSLCPTAPADLNTDRVSRQPFVRECAWCSLGAESWKAGVGWVSVASPWPSSSISYELRAGPCHLCSQRQCRVTKRAGCPAGCWAVGDRLSLRGRVLKMSSESSLRSGLCGQVRASVSYALLAAGAILLKSLLGHLL